MRHVPLLSLAVLVLAAPAEAKAEPGWSTPRTVTTSESGARQPLAVVDGNGRATVIWEHKRSGYNAVRTATETDVGSFGSTEQISQSSERDFRVSALVGNAAGEHVATWCSSRNGSNLVRVVLGAGQGFQSGLTFESGSTRSCADAAINPRGDVAIAWVADQRVRLLFKPAGGSFGSPVQVGSSARADTTPAVAIDEAGKVGVLWARDSLSSFKLVHASAPLGIPGVVQEVSADLLGDEARVDVDTDGAIAASWSVPSATSAGGRDIVGAVGSVVTGLGAPQGLGATSAGAAGEVSAAAGPRASFAVSGTATDSQGCQRPSYLLASNWQSPAIQAQQLADLPRFEQPDTSVTASDLGLAAGAGESFVSWLETHEQVDGCRRTILRSSSVRAALQPAGQPLAPASQVSDPRYPASDSRLNDSLTPAAAWKCFDGRKYRVQVATYGPTAGTPEWCGAPDTTRPRVRVTATRYPVRWRSKFRAAPRARCNEQCTATVGLLLFSAGSRAVKLGISEQVLQPNRTVRLAFPALTRPQKRRIARIVRTRRNPRFVFRLRFDDLALNSRLVKKTVRLRP